MSYAIIETGGKQLRVEPGRFYDIELLHVDPEVQVTIDKVLFVQHDGGVTIGQPFIEGATVEGTVMRHRRGKKVIVYKMRPKKKTRKKRGHRQEITQLMINSIILNGAVIASEQEATNEAQATTVTVAPEPEEITPTVTVEAQVVESAPVAEQPDAETVTPQSIESESVVESAPVAEQPEAGTVTPQSTESESVVESVAVAEEPEAETVTPQSTESESQ